MSILSPCNTRVHVHCGALHNTRVAVGHNLIMFRLCLNILSSPFSFVPFILSFILLLVLLRVWRSFAVQVGETCLSVCLSVLLAVAYLSYPSYLSNLSNSSNMSILSVIYLLAYLTYLIILFYSVLYLSNLRIHRSVYLSVCHCLSVIFLSIHQSIQVAISLPPSFRHL